jgi:protein-tyrosine phosphatase
MVPPRFVDVHSHVVPSGDDGAASVEEGIELCRIAFETGTRTLFATPHWHAPWDSYPWSRARELRFRQTFGPIRAAAAEWGLDLRRGWEMYPSEIPREGASALVLEGTRAVLVEFPGWWVNLDDAVALTLAGCERAEADGVVPVLAHPERCRAIADEPAAVAAFVERGWPLCVNAASLTNEHGPRSYETGWRLLEDGVVSLVASDGHRVARPPRLDRAYDLVVRRYGVEAARPLFEGAALPAAAGVGRVAGGQSPAGTVPGTRPGD